MAVSLKEKDGAVRLAVKAVPGSSRDRIVGVLGDALKIAVSAPPQAGEANRAIVKLLAGKLGVRVSQIQMVRGHSAPRKELLIRGASAQQIAAALGLNP